MYRPEPLHTKLPVHSCIFSLCILISLILSVGCRTWDPITAGSPILIVFYITVHAWSTNLYKGNNDPEIEHYEPQVWAQSFSKLYFKREIAPYLFIYLFIYLCIIYYAIIVVPTFLPLPPCTQHFPHSWTISPPLFMSMGHAYKFFGNTIFYTSLSIPLPLLYVPICTS